MAPQSDRAFLTTLLADIVLIIGYVISALAPDYRVWPIGDSKWRW